MVMTYNYLHLIILKIYVHKYEWTGLSVSVSNHSHRHIRFTRRFYPKRFTTVHTHIHKPTAESPTQGDSQLTPTPAQGRLSTQEGARTNKSHHGKLNSNGIKRLQILEKC
jgi:hypothetical protein